MSKRTYMEPFFPRIRRLSKKVCHQFFTARLFGGTNPFPSLASKVARDAVPQGILVGVSFCLA